MMSYNTYPPLPSAPSIGAQPLGGVQVPGPPLENPQAGYHLKVVQAKRRGLIAKEKMFKKKYKKYNKILN